MLFTVGKRVRYLNTLPMLSAVPTDGPMHAVVDAFELLATVDR